MQAEIATPCAIAISEDKGRNSLTENCMVCGLALEYLNEAHGLTCSYCGKVEEGHIKCPNGHYVCDVCHNRDAMRIIEDIAFGAKSKDPIEIAELMMSHPGLPMLGCQHAFIAGGALMAAIKNEGSRGISNEAIKEVFSRTEKQAHGGYCGLTGVCGIAPAIGACFSILTSSKCGTDREQRITMEAVIRVSRAIADLTGPSCCKAYIRSSLGVAADYLKESLDLDLPAGRAATCIYSEKHPHGCREVRCPYFGDHYLDGPMASIGGDKTLDLTTAASDAKGEQNQERELGPMELFCPGAGGIADEFYQGESTNGKGNMQNVRQPG